MRTIFITSFHGLVSRVLQSGVLDCLKKEENFKIVFLVPDFKKEYFKKEFSDKNVVIEGISEKLLPKSAYLLHKISFFLLHTKTMRIIRRSYRDYKNYPRYFLIQSIAVCLGRWRIVRNLFRLINYYFSGKPVFSDLFNKYKPDMVFSTDVKHVFDTQLLIEAKKRKIFTIAMVRSWDYLTAKGITRVMPDKMAVHNEIIKQEAVKYADMKEKDIEVVGIPHFDPYINYPRSQKEEFFRRVNADPESPLVFLAPLGDKFSDADWQIFEILCEAIKNKELPDNLQVLVRLPPGDSLNLRGFKPCENIIFDYPGFGFKDKHRKANEMSLKDLLHLADSLFYSEIVLTCASTICIDAAVFDKPIIFLGFDGKEKREYYKSVVNHFDYSHTQNVIKTGGADLAKSGDELADLINKYLKNPELKKEGRKKISQEQCWKLDGKSSERLADYLLLYLK